MRSCSSICTSVRRAMKRCIERPFGTDASHPGMGRRRIALATSAVSRKAFEATVPVFTIAPPGRDSRSIIATRRPNLAATSAAFSPAGPAPMQRRSYCHTETPSARRARNFSAIRSSSTHARNGGIHASNAHNPRVEVQGLSTGLKSRVELSYTHPFATSRTTTDQLHHECAVPVACLGRGRRRDRPRA